MKNRFLAATWNQYFDEHLDFRVLIFNTLGFLGCALGLIFGIYSIVNYAGIEMIIANFGTSVAAVGIIRVANRTGTFKTFFLLTVILVFFIIFPALFFMGGGYLSGMPCFFVFAVVFTVMMLEGRRRLILTVLEFILYTGCFLISIYYPQAVNRFPTEMAVAIDVVVGCLGSSVVLAIAITQHIRIYDKRQRQLEDANERLNSLNRIKIEFLQDIKHETRNPLTVIALGIDFIHNSIETGGDAEETRNALNHVQDEAMRLGRMINGMVEMAVMSEKPTNREKTDFAAILRQCVEHFQFQARQKNNILRSEIAPDLPFVYAEPEQLQHIPVNLLANAVNCTQDGEITLEATAGDGYITVRVRDNGEGVPPELLPRVFERGVSGKGGKGYGLAICKTIVEAHSGEIGMESAPGRGIVVTFTIPVYGGQDEARGESM